jgi:hypothetical protein
MPGTKLSPVKVTLRNPLNREDQLVYTITPEDNQLARDWHQALRDILRSGLHLEKNFCFLGFPHTPRTVKYLCDNLNKYITWINYYNATPLTWRFKGLESYQIEEYFSEETVRYPNDPALGTNQFRIKHDIFNRLHNHFEHLQGTVWNQSYYYKHANWQTRYAIRQLNLLCHELESLILSQRKLALDPHWVRPSQITTFVHAPRHELTDEHRIGFPLNRYDRVLGGVYMHWTQIGKTLYEVFRDESAPKLNVGSDPTDISLGSGTTCEAINSLKYYSGEFDIEWARDVVRGGPHPWHDQEQSQFEAWLNENNLSIDDPRLSLGYLKIGQVDLESSFGTVDPETIWKQLGQHLDIYKIEVGDVVGVFDYAWSDPDHEQRQLENLKRTEHAVD